MTLQAVRSNETTVFRPEFDCLSHPPPPLWRFVLPGPLVATFWSLCGHITEDSSSSLANSSMLQLHPFALLLGRISILQFGKLIIFEMGSIIKGYNIRIYVVQKR
jgi:hypothetical protein